MDAIGEDTRRGARRDGRRVRRRARRHRASLRLDVGALGVRPRYRCRWNELQNTHRDIQRLGAFLVRAVRESQSRSLTRMTRDPGRRGVHGAKDAQAAPPSSATSPARRSRSVRRRGAPVSLALRPASRRVTSMRAPLVAGSKCGARAPGSGVACSVVGAIGRDWSCARGDRGPCLLCDVRNTAGGLRVARRAATATAVRRSACGGTPSRTASSTVLRSTRGRSSSSLARRCCTSRRSPTTFSDRGPSSSAPSDPLDGVNVRGAVRYDARLERGRRRHARHPQRRDARCPKPREVASHGWEPAATSCSNWLTPGQARGPGTDV